MLYIYIYIYNLHYKKTRGNLINLNISSRKLDLLLVQKGVANITKQCCFLASIYRKKTSMTLDAVRPGPTREPETTRLEATGRDPCRAAIELLTVALGGYSSIHA